VTSASNHVNTHLVFVSVAREQLLLIFSTT